MNILSKVFKWISASGLIISTFFIFNFYFVLDSKSMDGAQCMALFHSNHLEICYNLLRIQWEFCPIGSEID